MEHLASILDEYFTFTAVSTLSLAIFLHIAKDIIITKVKSFFCHFRKKKKIYFVSIGVVSGLLIATSFFTIYSKIEYRFKENEKRISKTEKITKKLNKIVKSIQEGSMSNAFNEFIRDSVSLLKNDLIKLEDYYLNYKSIDSSYYEDHWKKRHFSIVFGIVAVDFTNKTVTFEYKNVVGKDPNSEKKLDYQDFIAVNENLFGSILPVAKKDADIFFKLNKRTEQQQLQACLDKPIYWEKCRQKEELQKEKCEKKLKADPCMFFYTLDYITGDKQKVFNDLNYSYYILKPHNKNGKSKLFFWYSINSDYDFKNDYSGLGLKTSMYLYRFSGVVENYLQKLDEL